MVVICFLSIALGSSSQSAQKIAASERIYRNVIDQHKKTLIEICGDDFKIDKRKLKSIEDLSIILFEILDDYGFNFHQTQNVLSAIERQSGKSFYSKDYQLVVDRQFLFITKMNEDKIAEVLVGQNEASVEVFENSVTFEQVDSKEVAFTDNNNIFETGKQCK